MKVAAFRLIESAVIRVGPGLLNLLALGLLADRLTFTSYGTYSTTFATVTTLGSVLLGPITYGVLPEYSRNITVAEQKRFVGLVVGIIAASFGIALFFMLIVQGMASATLAIIASGGMTALQELLRAQLRLWGYGAVALTQSATFAASIFLFVNHDDPGLALWLYSGSCSLGVIIAFALLGFPAPRVREFGRLKQSLKIGGIYTASSLVESSFLLGTRYLFLAYGAREALAVYSFCIDISQRLVGVMINLATFQFVPRAYKRAEEAGDSAFLSVLRQGASVGATAALASMLLILGGREVGLLPPKIFLLLDPPIFILVALALAVNRLKKLLVDPVAIRFNKAHFILIGYLISAPITFGVVALILRNNGYYGVAVALLGGYLFATIFARTGYARALAERERAAI